MEKFAKFVIDAIIAGGLLYVMDVTCNLIFHNGIFRFSPLVEEGMPMLKYIMVGIFLVPVFRRARVGFKASFIKEEYQRIQTANSELIRKDRQ